MTVHQGAQPNWTSDQPTLVQSRFNPNVPIKSFSLITHLQYYMVSTRLVSIAYEAIQMIFSWNVFIPYLYVLMLLSVQ